MILRPITKSSLKLKKANGIHAGVSEVKEGWGMHLNVAVLKLKSNESQLAKKIRTFLDYFFLSIVEAGGSAFTAVRIGSYLIKFYEKIN